MRKKTVLLNAKLIETSFGNLMSSMGQRGGEENHCYFGEAWVIALMFMW